MRLCISFRFELKANFFPLTCCCEIEKHLKNIEGMLLLVLKTVCLIVSTKISKLVWTIALYFSMTMFSIVCLNANS